MKELLGKLAILNESYQIDNRGHVIGANGADYGHKDKGGMLAYDAGKSGGSEKWNKAMKPKDVGEGVSKFARPQDHQHDPDKPHSEKNAHDHQMSRDRIDVEREINRQERKHKKPVDHNQDAIDNYKAKHGNPLYKNKLPESFQRVKESIAALSDQEKTAYFNNVNSARIQRMEKRHEVHEGTYMQFKEADPYRGGMISPYDNDPTDDEMDQEYEAAVETAKDVINSDVWPMEQQDFVDWVSSKHELLQDADVLQAIKQAFESELNERKSQHGRR
jgi:hypothetical protein